MHLIRSTYAEKKVDVKVVKVVNAQFLSETAKLKVSKDRPIMIIKLRPQQLIVKRAVEGSNLNDKTSVCPCSRDVWELYCIRTYFDDQSGPIDVRTASDINPGSANGTFVCRKFSVRTNRNVVSRFLAF